MTIPFGDTVKAQLTQAVISSLLEAGGYRVIRLGIEELFREVKSIELEQYRAMNLPAQLRYLPDLLVTSTATNQACLVEVKFRRRFDDSSARALFEKLERQRRYWPDSHAVLTIAEPFAPDGRFHQDYIRVLPAHATRRLIDARREPRRRWKRLPHLWQVFRELPASTDHRALADCVSQALRTLAEL
jgi:hypothetical protein